MNLIIFCYHVNHAHTLLWFSPCLSPNPSMSRSPRYVLLQLGEGHTLSRCLWSLSQALLLVTRLNQTHYDYKQQCGLIREKKRKIDVLCCYGTLRASDKKSKITTYSFNETPKSLHKSTNIYSPLGCSKHKRY